MFVWTIATYDGNNQRLRTFGEFESFADAEKFRTNHYTRGMLPGYTARIETKEI